jgi:hypothetical protein
MLNLEPIKARLESAPPGPWTAEYDDLTEETYLMDAKGQFGIATIYNCRNALEPLVNYPTDMSALIEEVERLRAECTRYRRVFTDLGINLHKLENTVLDVLAHDGYVGTEVNTESKQLRAVLKQLVDACTNGSSFDEVNLALLAADNILKEES